MKTPQTLPLLTAILASGAAAWGQVPTPLPYLHKLPGEAGGETMGVNVDGLGDLDGDGHDDFGVALPRWATPLPGIARIHSGADGAVIRELAGSDQESVWQVCGVADIDGDGVRDQLVQIVQTPSISSWGPDPGTVRLHSGATGALLREFVGQQAGDYLGHGLADAGDVNADGTPDLLIGASQMSLGSRGYVEVRSGVDGSLLHRFEGDAENDLFCEPAGPGDVDGDGYADIIVGAQQRTAPENSGAGYARVFSGVDGSMLYELHGDQAMDNFGFDIAATGDLDADGRPDFAIGAWQIDAVGTGYVRVFSGADGTTLATLAGDGPGDLLCRVDGIGDADGDGVPDLALGAPQDPLVGFVGAGYVRIHSGADFGVLVRFEGDAHGDGFGAYAAGAGDVNGDGFADVVVGAPWEGLGGPYSGGAHVLTLQGARRYGQGLGGLQTLDLGWSPGPAGVLAAGRIDVSGAAPFSAGVIAVGQGFGQAPIPGGTLLVAMASVVLVPYVHGPDGAVSFPVDLSSGPLAGQALYVQAAELDPAVAPLVRTSNGLELLFGP